MNNSEKTSLGRFCFKGTGRKFIRKLVGETPLKLGLSQFWTLVPFNYLISLKGAVVALIVW